METEKEYKERRRLEALEILEDLKKENKVRFEDTQNPNYPANDQTPSGT